MIKENKEIQTPITDEVRFKWNRQNFYGTKSYLYAATLRHATQAPWPNIQMLGIHAI